jgi:uncharacterized protein
MMSTIEIERAASDGPGARRRIQVVDCDVHPYPATPQQYLQFLPSRWHHLERHTTPIPFRIDLVHGGTRTDTWSPDGGPPCSDPRHVDRQLLDGHGVDYAVLVYHTHGCLPDPAADAAQHRALNEWLVRIWLEDGNPHGRYRGSIRVPLHDPKAAVAEIEHWAGHPHVVQVLALHAYQPGFGHPMYEPVWRAASDAGMPIAVHATTYGSALYQWVTPVGAPAHYFEWHSASYPFTYAAHLSSLLLSGVFDRVPDLRFVFLEGGISWAQPLIDRLDRYWLRLRTEASARLRDLPSAYLADHVRFSTQPIEEPRDSRALLDVYERLRAEQVVMFSTDYPHWDFDDPGHALPVETDDSLRRRIMFETACDLYDLPRERDDREASTA